MCVSAWDPYNVFLCWNDKTSSSFLCGNMSTASSIVNMRRITHPTVQQTLAGKAVLPCVFTLQTSSSSQPPHLLWTRIRLPTYTTLLYSIREHVNKAFSSRVMLPGYAASPLNATMEISSLRTNDSGTYQCQVVMGTDYERDTVPLVVSGVVFHYQAPSARYALSFTDAQRACQEISAQMATPAQLWAAYYDGFASCAAGWLDDQTVRYSVRLPELGCYGHKEYSAGVRNYGKRDPKELFDVYCFAKELDGEVFHSSVPGRLSLSSASDRCVSLGGQLATVGQLYLAWRAGLDSCAPGWLSDGSVRYPVTWPRPDCGGSQPGVRTITPNSTTDNTTALYDAYCYRGIIHLFYPHQNKSHLQTEKNILLQNITNELLYFESLNSPSTPIRLSLSVEVEPCVTNPCLHGGKCLPQGTGYSCYCPQGYAGENCEIDVDDCQSEPCENGGTCIDKIDSFLCLCLPSYGGDTCEKDIEGCEHGWRKFHGHCYRYFTHRHTWEDAEKDCREHSAHLSSVISATEQEFINGLGHDNAWIGLNDRTVEEDFQWTDSNDLVYENWRESQPDNFFAGGEDCVVTIAHEDGKWNDVPCNYNLPYICKKGTVLCGTPPAVENAHLIGRRRSHYDIHAVVRYQCAEGFFQRHIPTARCRADGSWERPRIICTKSRRSHRYRRHHHNQHHERRSHRRHGGEGHKAREDAHSYY
uniref:Neurocan b n=1 Tax=Dicentrarchus labrax TaxID=13489 RepID=A0A8C4IPV7_DICLA